MRAGTTNGSLVLVCRRSSSPLGIPLFPLNLSSHVSDLKYSKYNNNKLDWKIAVWSNASETPFLLYINTKLDLWFCSGAFLKWLDISIGLLCLQKLPWFSFFFYWDLCFCSIMICLSISTAILGFSPVVSSALLTLRAIVLCFLICVFFTWFFFHNNNHKWNRFVLNHYFLRFAEFQYPLLAPILGTSFIRCLLIVFLAQGWGLEVPPLVSFSILTSLMCFKIEAVTVIKYWCSM